MAIGTVANMVIYHEEFWGGMGEVLAQNVNAFNGASNNALRLVTRLMRGHYEKESFVKKISSLVTRRDITSTSAVTSLALTQGEQVGVKLNRKLGPVEDTLDAWRKVAPTEDAAREFSFMLGQQSALDIQGDYLNSVLIALEAALDGQAALEYDATDGNLQFVDLNAGFALFGDRADRIRTLVMHSKVFHNLRADGITNYKIENVAGMMIVTGGDATMGKSIVVSDSAALVTATTPLRYSTLGLVEDAAEVAESEQRELHEEIVGGKENLTLLIQGEHAFNVKLKGFTWDVANGGSNPDNTALGTESNWDKTASSDKDLPGIIIKSQ
jgi:hypothetical protein